MSKKTKKIVMIILDVIIVLLAIYFVIGYVNFKKISNNEEPMPIYKESSYSTDDGVIKVYDGLIYKIVRNEIPGKNVKLSLKLWFMDNEK